MNTPISQIAKNLFDEALLIASKKLGYEQRHDIYIALKIRKIEKDLISNDAAKINEACKELETLNDYLEK